MNVLHKVMLRLANSIRLTLTAYIISLVIAAALFAFAEHRSLGDGLWWAVVSALTIGYGDISPVTTVGRIVAVIFQHFWIMVIAPLVISNVVVRVIHNKDQYTDDEQKWTATSLQIIATKLGAALPKRPQDTDYGNND